MNKTLNNKLKKALFLFFYIFILLGSVFICTYSFKYFLNNYISTLFINNFISDLIFISLLSIFLTIIFQNFFYLITRFICGKTLEYMLLTFRFSIFTWNLENDKIVFFINKKNIFVFSLEMSPFKTITTNKGQALFYLSGFLMNFIILTITFIMFTSLNNDLVSLFLFFSIIVSTIMVLKRAISYTIKQNESDGKMSLIFALNKPLAKQFSLMISITHQICDGIRPRDLIIDKYYLSIDTNNKYYFSILIYMYLYALDNNDKDLINKYIKIIENSIDKVSQYTREIYYNELIYYYSSINKNKEKAIYYYNLNKNSIDYDMDINGCRVLASYEYYINNNKQKVLEYIAKAIVVADSFSLKGQLILEKDLLFKLQKEII